jgi:hypothetical protein
MATRAGLLTKTGAPERRLTMSQPTDGSDREGAAPPHLIENLVDGTAEPESRPDLVDGVAAGDPLAEENALLAELEFHRGPGPQSQALPNLQRHRDLTFGRDGASHG